MTADEFVVWRSILTTSDDNAAVSNNSNPWVCVRLGPLLVLVLREVCIVAWTLLLVLVLRQVGVVASKRQVDCHHGGAMPNVRCDL